MAKVPYQPYSDVAPSTSPLSVATPEGAFGERTAKATEGLGREIAGAGDKLYHRAMAMQEVNNATESDEANVQFILKQGDLYADYNAKQGKDRVDAYPAYRDATQKLREDIAAGMKNPMSQKMFRAKSGGELATAIRHGAASSATAQKDWVDGTAKGVMKVNQQKALADPEDEEAFKTLVDKTRENAYTSASTKGFGRGNPAAEAVAADEVSKLWYSRIDGLNFRDSFKAATMLDDAKKQGVLIPDDLRALEEKVRSKMRSEDTAVQADAIDQWGKGDAETPAKSMDEKLAKAKEVARQRAPQDRVKYETALIAAIQSKELATNRFEAQEEHDNRAIVNTAILRGVKDEAQLRGSLKDATALDKTSEEFRLSVPGRINRYNKARDEVANDEEFYKLKALARNDPEGYRNTDVTKSKMSQQQMDWHMNNQMREQKAAAADYTRQAVRTLQGARGQELEALGVYTRTQRNKDQYDKFEGLVDAAIDVWKEEHGGKPPNSDDIKNTIGPNVIQQYTRPSFLGRFFGETAKEGDFLTEKKPIYDVVRSSKAYKDFETRTQQDIRAAGGLEATPEQIDQAFIRSEYIRLHGKKKE